MTRRLVVLPQAMRVIIPPLGNTFNSLLKTTSLASVISMEELLRRTEVPIQVQFKVLEIFIVAALYYLVMTTIWGFVQIRLEAHFSKSHAPIGGASPQRSQARAAIEKVMLTRDAQ
jgi:polar amino acid transport system permease protein